MRWIITILFFISFVGETGSAQSRKSLPGPVDTVFNDNRVGRFIEYIRIKPLYQSETQAIMKREHIVDNNIGILGALVDIAWHNDWCEYRKLNGREKHETFNLRLIHHRSLQRLASNKLKRDVAKKGFGFYLEGVMVNDYNYTDKGGKIAARVFRKALGKYGFKPCVDLSQL